MNARRLLSIAVAAILAATPAFAADKPAAPAQAASAAKAADCVDMSKMHDHGAEKGVARSKHAGCKSENPGLANKDRHQHGKFNKQQ